MPKTKKTTPNKRLQSKAAAPNKRIANLKTPTTGAAKTSKSPK